MADKISEPLITNSDEDNSDQNHPDQGTQTDPNSLSPPDRFSTCKKIVRAIKRNKVRSAIVAAIVAAIVLLVILIAIFHYSIWNFAVYNVYLKIHPLGCTVNNQSTTPHRCSNSFSFLNPNENVAECGIDHIDDKFVLKTEKAQFCADDELLRTDNMMNSLATYTYSLSEYFTIVYNVSIPIQAYFLRRVGSTDYQRKATSDFALSMHTSPLAWNDRGVAAVFVTDWPAEVYISHSNQVIALCQNTIQALELDLKYYINKHGIKATSIHTLLQMFISGVVQAYSDDKHDCRGFIERHENTISSFITLLAAVGMIIFLIKYAPKVVRYISTKTTNPDGTVHEKRAVEVTHVNIASTV